MRIRVRFVRLPKLWRQDGVLELRAAARCDREDPGSGRTSALNIPARRRGHPSEVEARWMEWCCLRWAALPVRRLMRAAGKKLKASVGQGRGVSEVVRPEMGCYGELAHRTVTRRLPGASRPLGLMPPISLTTRFLPLRGARLMRAFRRLEVTTLVASHLFRAVDSSCSSRCNPRSPAELQASMCYGPSHQ